VRLRCPCRAARSTKTSSGAIDATEWVGPFNDYFMKFYEAAKYYYYPGMHEPGAQLAMGMNKAWWDALDDRSGDHQAACNEENALTMAETNANNGVSTSTV
jgi:TRAP-type mannitol/chloroaromatic compound transport system substrate-binding protein